MVDGQTLTTSAIARVLTLELRAPTALDRYAKFGLMALAVILLLPALLVLAAIALFVPRALGVPLHAGTRPRRP